LAVNFDLAPDGRRFIVLMPAETTDARERQSHMTLVANFFDQVQRVEGRWNDGLWLIGVGEAESLGSD
jgi:hypothetical protein